MIYIILLLELEMKKIYIDNQYENDDNNYTDINDFITPHHYIGIKNDNEILLR